MRRTGLAVVLAAAVPAALAWGAACAAGDGRGATITRSDGPTTDRITLSRDGYALWQLDGAGARTSGLLIDYRTRRVTLVDPRRRLFQTIGLNTVITRRLAERRVLRKLDTPYFALPDGVVAPAERLRPLRGRRIVRGLPARAYLLTRKGQPATRLWYARSLPKPPPAVAKLLALLGAAGAGSLAGNVVLRAEQRIGRRYRIELVARRIRSGRVRSRTFRAPKGYARTATLLPAGVRASRSVPARVRRQADYFPIQSRPEIFAVYEGARFASEPETIRRLDAALSGTILQRPYIDGLAQYGVGPGQFIGHMVIPVDPPFVAGQTTVRGWANNMAIAQRARTAGAPFAWSRLGPDPLIVIFVPAEVVDPASNLGYHSVMPVETALLDPLGLLLVQVYPFAIVKVPTFSPSFSHVDGATVVASHETVETASDPVPAPAGFVDPAKALIIPTEQTEIGDICQEGAIAPWSRLARVNGVGVATYWSENTQTCVPESRPSLRIETPAGGTTVERGQPISFLASGTDLWSGTLPSMNWASDVDGSLGGGTNTTPVLSVGRHVVTVTAGGTGGSTRTASVTVNVVSRPPTVRITRPVGGGDYPSDQNIVFRGTATDLADGRLAGDALVWTIDGSESATRGAVLTGGLLEGTHTALLRATNTHGESATASVTFTIGAPTGGPSVQIDTPFQDQSFPSGGTDPVAFGGHGTDLKDKTLAGAQLQWFDDYVDALGVARSVNFGSGPTASTPLFSGGFNRAHTIRLVGTDTDGNTAMDAVEVTSGVG